MKKLIVVACLLFFFFGCTSEWKTIAGSDSVLGPRNDTAILAGDPVSIGYLSVTDTFYSDEYKITFDLLDDAGNTVRADGSATLTILEKNNSTVLYESTFEVRSSEFNETKGGFFSKKPLRQYIKTFNSSLILDSTESYGIAHLIFTTKDGKVFEKYQEYVYLPYDYTYDYGYDTAYNDSDGYTPVYTKNVMNQNDLEVLLYSYGVYKDPYYYTTSMRTDINITNKGSSSAYIRYRDSALVYNGVQYQGYQISYPQYKIFPSATERYSLGFSGLSAIPKSKFTVYLEVSTQEALTYDQPVNYTTIKVDIDPTKN